MANTSTASELLDTVSRELEDPSNDTWGRYELLGFLNDGLRALAAFRPEEFLTCVVYPLVPGTRQTLPYGTLVAYRAMCNTNSSGTTRGRAIRMVTVESLDASSPGWRSATATTAVRECAIPDNSALEYWVSPPSDGAGYIEMSVSKAPEILLNAATIPCTPDYYPALIDYVVYRALAKDAEYGAQDGRAELFYKKFLNLAAPSAPQQQG
jgi:hypothetical protein